MAICLNRVGPEHPGVCVSGKRVSGYGVFELFRGGERVGENLKNRSGNEVEAQL